MKAPRDHEGGVIHGVGGVSELVHLPEPLHMITSRPVQWPGPGGPGTRIPGSGSVPDPIHSLPIIVANNPTLAAKPQSKPPHPTIASVLSSLPLGLQFSFNQLTSPTPYGNVISAYRIYVNKSANQFSGAQFLRSFLHDPTHQGPITVQDSTGAGKSYFYFVTAVDTTGQESVAVGAQAGAIVSQSALPNINEAFGSTNLPQTTSNVYSVIPQMTITATFRGNKVLIVFTATLFFQAFTGKVVGQVAIFKDGTQLSQDYVLTFDPGTATNSNITMEWPFAVTFIDTPTAGSHTYDIRWLRTTTNAPFVADGVARRMQVLELG